MSYQSWGALVVVAASLGGCAVGVTDEPYPDDAEPAIVGRAVPPPIDVPESIERSLPESTEPEVLTENEACERIQDAITERALFIGCQVTTHVCPDMLTIDAGQACLLYDGAAVDACTVTITHSHMCGMIPHLPCNTLAIADSAPNGCPLDSDEPS